MMTRIKLEPAASGGAGGPSLPLAIYGTIIHSVTAQEVEFLEQGLLVVNEDGKIAHLDKNVQPSEMAEVLSRYGLDRSSHQ